MSLAAILGLSTAITTRELGNALLGAGFEDPFAGFKAKQPRDMAYNDWYPHSQLRQHADLVDVLVAGLGSGGWVLELGSFIGNSASVWAAAIKRQKLDATLVCMDTWLGDVFMWKSKGQWLGPQSRSGQPRLYEQFMLNVAGKNVSDVVIPVRTSAIVGLKYVLSLMSSGRVPPPGVIYLDAAHEYPETELEIQFAWEVLAPGGLLLGDDYVWPGVQQSVNEFVLRHANAIASPWKTVRQWARRGMHPRSFRAVALLDAPAGDSLREAAPLLIKGRQWMMLKPVNGTSTDLGSTKWSRAALRCCINGWNATGNAACRPMMSWLGQGTCKEQGGGKDGRPSCELQRLACLEPRSDFFP